MIGDKEIKEGRKRLPKGHTRETNTAHTVGYDQVDSDDDSVSLTVAPTHIAQAAIPREVADDIFGMMWDWGRKSPEAYALMVQIMRNSDHEAFGHLSDDELREKIEQHARDASRKATETVYADQWDKGNDLDMWQGKPVYSAGGEGLTVVDTEPLKENNDE